MLLLLCLFCVLQPVIHVFGDDEKSEKPFRFIVEEVMKLAIFGSHIYDPLKQVFEEPPHNGTDGLKHQFVNNTHILSTAVGGTSDILSHTTTEEPETPPGTAMRASFYSPVTIDGNLKRNVFRNLLAANTVSTPKPRATLWWSRTKNEPTKDFLGLKKLKDIDEAKKLLLALNAKESKYI